MARVVIIQLQSNIRKLYALIVAQDALTIVPVFIPFMQSHGLNLEQIFLLQGIYTFTWVVTDIPTGYLADIWSRRKSLIAGSFILCLSGIGFAFGNQFWHFCVVEILFGLGRACNSATIQAMTYDTLAEFGNTGNYRKICSSQNIASYLSTAIAGIVGGLAAQLNLQWAGILMLPLFIITFGVSLTINEPKRHILQHAGYLNLISISRDIFLSPPLRIIMLIYGLVAALTFSVVWFTQPYQIQLQIPLKYFGVLNALFMCGRIIASRAAYILEKRLDDRWFLVIIIGTVLACYLILGQPVFFLGLIFLLIGGSTYGALDVLTSDMINRLTTSDRRATVLSTRSLVYNLIFTVFSPFIGYATRLLSLNDALFMVGISTTILMIPVLFLLRKTWKTLPV